MIEDRSMLEERARQSAREHGRYYFNGEDGPLNAGGGLIAAFTAIVVAIALSLMFCGQEAQAQSVSPGEWSVSENGFTVHTFAYSEEANRIAGLTFDCVSGGRIALLSGGIDLDHSVSTYRVKWDEGDYFDKPVFRSGRAGGEIIDLHVNPGFMEGFMAYNLFTVELIMGNGDRKGFQFSLRGATSALSQLPCYTEK